MKWQDQEFRWTLILILLTLPLHWVFITFRGPFSYDEGVYLATTQSLLKGFSLYAQIYHTQWPLFVKVLAGVESFFEGFFQQVLIARLFILVHGALLIFAFARLLVGLGVRGSTHLLALVLFAFNPQVFFLSHTVLGNIPALAWAILALSFAIQTGKISWLSPLLMALALNFKLLVAPFVLALRKWKWWVVCGAVSLGMAFAFGFSLSASQNLQGGALLGAIERTSALDKLQWYFEGMGIRAWGEAGVLKHWIFPLTSILGFLAFVFLIWRGRREFIKVRALELFLWPLLILSVHSTVWKHHFVILVPGIVLMLIVVLNTLNSGFYKRILRALAVTQIVFLILNASYQQRAQNVWSDESSDVTEFLRRGSANMVITDHPWYALQAEMSVLPELVDTSKVRIKTGQLSCENFKILLEKNPESLVMDSGRFSLLECGGTFQEWLFSQGYSLVFKHKEIQIYQRTPQPIRST